MSHGLAALKWKAAALAAVMAASLAAPAGWAQGRGAKSELHLPQDRRVSFTQNLTDGAGYTWDLQYGLMIGQGLNYIYGGGGMRLQVRNSNFNWGGQGFMNAAGDEVEIGPVSMGDVQVYRRCKVYKDVGLARWLDIFVNTTGQAQTLPVRVSNNTNSSFSQVVTDSEAAAFGEKDFAFITEHQGNQVSLLHIPCGPKSKLRPTINAPINSNAISFNYDLTLPANGTVVICYFEGQGRSVTELKERIKAFRTAALLKDLSGEVRKLIVNFPNESELAEIELARAGAYDTVVRKNGDVIYGQIVNETFTIEAFYGTLPLPAKDIIGFAQVNGQDQMVRAVLSGGQVITGRLKDNNLQLKLPTGGELKIGFDKLSQCSYRISKEKPQETEMKDPLIMLRSGTGWPSI